MRNTHWHKLTYQDAGLEQAVEKAAAWVEKCVKFALAQEVRDEPLGSQ